MCDVEHSLLNRAIHNPDALTSFSLFHILTNLILKGLKCLKTSNLKKMKEQAITFYVCVYTYIWCTFFLCSNPLPLQTQRPHIPFLKGQHIWPMKKNKSKAKWLSHWDMPSAVSSFLWRECPGASQASSLMLAHLLGHEKRCSILKCTWKLNTSHCRTKCCEYTDAFDEQEPHEFYTRGSFPEGFEHWPQVTLSVYCIYKG